MKGGNKFRCKGKPMRDLFPIKVIKATQSSVLQKIQVPAYFAFANKVFVLRKNYLLKTMVEGLCCFNAKRMVLTNMPEQAFDGGKLRKTQPVLFN